MNVAEHLTSIRPTLEGDERWQLALRVAASERFRKSPRLHEFLLYVSEKALTCRLDEVHEQQIGARVFGRRPDYNASEDNIVRVEARELRKRLGLFFDNEGQSEPLIIQIPKGTYVPEFVPRSLLRDKAAAESADQATVPVRGISSDINSLEESHSRKPSLPAVIMVIAWLVLAGICLWLWRENRALRTDQSLSSETSAPIRSHLWPLLFNPQQTTQIIIADSCLAYLQDASHTEISLKDYLTRRYLNDLNSPELRLIASRQYTSTADASITGRILALNAAHKEHTTVRYARNLQLQDLKTGNAILLGTRRSNPWCELFDPERNFRFEIDLHSMRHWYVNKVPRSGEEARYFTGGKDGTSDEAYAVISFLPNLNSTGNILMIEGTSMEGTEAAGEYVTNSNLFSRFEEQLLSASKGPSLPYFELLLKTRTLAGASREAVSITYRVLTPPPGMQRVSSLDLP